MHAPLTGAGVLAWSQTTTHVLLPLLRELLKLDEAAFALVEVVAGWLALAAAVIAAAAAAAAAHDVTHAHASSYTESVRVHRAQRAASFARAWRPHSAATPRSAQVHCIA